MTFPDKGYPSIADYCDDYIARLARAGASIDRAALARAADMLDAAFGRSAWLFVCGNGGSAAIANHLLCDVAKGVQTDTGVLPRVMSLSSNLEIVTAIANDIAFEDCFLYQLRTAARAGDLLMTISSSGDSENIVRALDGPAERYGEHRAHRLRRRPRGAARHGQPPRRRRQLRRDRGHPPVDHAHARAIPAPGEDAGARSSPRRMREVLSDEADRQDRGEADALSRIASTTAIRMAMAASATQPRWRSIKARAGGPNCQRIAATM